MCLRVFDGANEQERGSGDAVSDESAPDAAAAERDSGTVVDAGEDVVFAVPPDVPLSSQTEGRPPPAGGTLAPRFTAEAWSAPLPPGLEPSRPYGTRTVRVDAQPLHVSTGLYLKRGDVVNLTATGRVTTWPGVVDGVGPEGRVVGKPAAPPVCAHGQLEAEIGLIYAPAVLHCLDARSILTADRDGILYLRVQDGVHRDSGGRVERSDNSGAFDVEIEAPHGRVAPRVLVSELASFNLGAIRSPVFEVESEAFIQEVPTAGVRGKVASVIAGHRFMDRAYAAYVAVTGVRPFGGEKIRLVRDPSIAAVHAAMLSGNPIRANPRPDFPYPLDDRQFLALDHELGHDFTSHVNGIYLVGPGPTEGWANALAYVTARKTGHYARMPQFARAEADLANKRLNYLEHGSYAEFLKNVEPSWAMLLEIRDRYGDGWFERFFRAFYASSADEMPAWEAPDHVRWSYAKRFFDRAAGEDTRSLFDKYRIPLGQ